MDRLHPLGCALARLHIARCPLPPNPPFIAYCGCLQPGSKFHVEASSVARFPLLSHVFLLEQTSDILEPLHPVGIIRHHICSEVLTVTNPSCPQVFLDYINAAGLPLLNELILDYGGASIKAVLDVVCRPPKPFLSCVVHEVHGT